LPTVRTYARSPSFVVHGVGLQDASVGDVQPRHHDQLGLGQDSMKRWRELRVDFENRVGCPLERLVGRVPRLVEV
jgi:hypothetical protein